ncbi:hypothetical protein Hsero_2811 [Herbaspirillum seropedicae SmR1]|uniref:Uncharacterized protein n=1 Tax=Herbaspirillum seropedicae (strain SmR1) TaxID=757424 RepID=D8IYW9_HERSS|nr:hypothetical protein Hsero_2811 [Herbaspirillum seropedicae SmR1]
MFRLVVNRVSFLETRHPTSTRKMDRRIRIALVMDMITPSQRAFRKTPKNLRGNFELPSFGELKSSCPDCH